MVRKETGRFSSWHAVWIAVALLALSAHSGAQIAFQETSDAAGFRHSGETYGASWSDFNGDGLPDLFVNNHREWASLYRNNGDGTFTDVILTADGSGIWKTKPKQDNHGASFTDFDGDGDTDLYVTTGAADPGLLLVNVQNILYNDAPLVGLSGDVEGRFPVWFDYQNDGYSDLAIMIRSASRVFRRNAGGLFTNVTSDVGLDCTAMDYGQVSDFDGDDRAELICGDGTFPRKVYDVTTIPFTDITSNVESIPRGTDSAIADYDGDLDPDVFVIAGKKIPSEVALTSATALEAAIGVAPGEEKGFSFQTTGLVTFNVYVKRQIDDPSNVYIGGPPEQHPTSMSFTLDPSDPTLQGVFPHDPATDAGIYISYDPSTTRWQVFTSGLADHAAGGYFVVSSTSNISNPTLINVEIGDMPEPAHYLDNVNGILTEDSGFPRGLDSDLSCVSVTSGDWDNDGDVDLYLVCRGGVQNLPNLIYENQGDGTFALITGTHGAEGVLGFHLTDKAGLGDSAAVADYNLDGCLDIFVTNGLPLQPGRHDSGPDQLFRNACNNGNHWIQFDLVGNGAGGSNPDGIGAKVYVTAGGVTQLREQNGGYHRWSQNDRRVHFGLGGSTTISQVRVVWPSGTEDIHTDIAADQFLVLHEGQSNPIPVTFGGGDFPAPQPGDECGEPTFNAGIHRAIFLYKNNCASDVWSLRATAGRGPMARYDGNVVSDEPLLNVFPVSLEGADIVDDSVAGQVVFDLRMSSGGTDGFDFTLAPTASGCLSVDQLADEAQILLGDGSIPAGTTIDLDTLGSCTQTQTPGLSVDDLVVNEGDGTAVFTVTLSASSSNTVQVNYATANGSATAPADYASRSGTLTIAPGATVSGPVSVPIVNDNLPEAPETFLLQLSGAVNANIVDGEGQATINDNEQSGCGEPVIDPAMEKGVFLWRDCPNGGWNVRVAGAGINPKYAYDGQVTAEDAFPSAPSPYLLEPDDVLDSSNPLTISYVLNVVNAGVDGFAFDAPATGQTCFGLSNPDQVGNEIVEIRVGASKTPSGRSVNLDTLESCDSQPPSCGEPDIDLSNDQGVFLWRDCPNGGWNVRVAGAGVNPKYAYEGQVKAAIAFPSAPTPYLLESDDVLDNSSPLAISYLLNVVNAGVDGFKFDAPATGETCFTVSAPQGVQIFLGAGENAVGTAVNLDTLGTCNVAPQPCGEPTIDPSAEKGVFLWRDCPNSIWNVRVTGAGINPKYAYVGQVTAENTFPSEPTPYLLEADDTAAIDVSDPTQILYDLTVINAGVDGFGFDPPATGGTCFTVSSPGDVQIHMGVAKDALGTAVDLDTLGVCTP